MLGQQLGALVPVSSNAHLYHQGTSNTVRVGAGTVVRRTSHAVVPDVEAGANRYDFSKFTFLPNGVSPLAGALGAPTLTEREAALLAAVMKGTLLWGVIGMAGAGLLVGAALAQPQTRLKGGVIGTVLGGFTGFVVSFLAAGSGIAGAAKVALAEQAVVIPAPTATPAASSTPIDTRTV